MKRSHKLLIAMMAVMNSILFYGILGVGGTEIISEEVTVRTERSEHWLRDNDGNIVGHWITYYDEDGHEIETIEIEV